MIIAHIKAKASPLLYQVDRHHLRILQITIMILMLAGLVYSVVLGRDFRYPDEQEYYTLAQNIATKGSFSLDGLHPTASRPPGYPLVLSVFLYLGADVWFLRVLNFAFLSGSIFFLHALLTKTATNRAAVLGTILAVCYPVLFYTAGTLYPQTLCFFLLLLFVYLAFMSGPQTIILAFLSGIVMGFLILTVPTFALVLGVTLLIMFSRLRAKAAGLILAGTFIVVGAWTFRNYQVFHSFVPIASNSGVNLLLGKSEKSNADAGVNIDITQYTTQTTGMNEVERDAYYRSEAIKFIIGNPQKALNLYTSNFVNYFAYRNDLYVKTEEAPWKDWLMLLTYGPLLVLFLLRLFLLKTFPFTRIEVFFIIAYLSNAFFQAIFFTRIRYRLPYDLLLIGSVAIFLSAILERFLLFRLPQPGSSGGSHA